MGVKMKIRAQPDMFGTDPKTQARNTDPHTSHQAARMMKYDLNDLKWKVMEALCALGLATDLEINAYCFENYGGRAESTYRKRRGELAEAGLVKDTGHTRWQGGRNRIVWALTETGQELISNRP